jgi:hypothetical protein
MVVRLESAICSVLLVPPPLHGAIGSTPTVEGIRPMTHYRFYCLDDTGHIASGADVEAQDDLAAIEIAQERCKENTIEVWQAERRVIQVPKHKAA